MPGMTYWSTIAGSVFHERVEGILLGTPMPSITDHVQAEVDKALWDSPYEEEDIRVSKALPSGLKATDHPYGFDKAAVVAAIPLWLGKWRKFMAEQEADGWVVYNSTGDRFGADDALQGIEFEVKYNLGGHPIIGSIDLVMRHQESGDVALWDYKAGRSKPEDTSQLDGYRIGFEEATGIIPARAGFWMARTGKEHLTANLPTFSKSMLDVKFRDAGERARAAEAGDFQIDRTQCQYLCGVKAFCPVQGGSLSHMVQLPTPTVRAPGPAPF